VALADALIDMGEVFARVSETLERDVHVELATPEDVSQAY
jgi:hypothetical protein